MKKLISGLIVLVMITAFMTGSVFAAAPGEPTESFDADTRASGITYGPWFGNGNESWSTDIKSLASATSTITGAISFCLPPSAARLPGRTVIHMARFKRSIEKRIIQMAPSPISNRIIRLRHMP